MQINSVKDSTKVLETGLKDIDKDVQVQEPIYEKISLGEASNKNIRTKTLTYGDTVNKLKEEDRELNKFKEKADKAVETLEYNAKSLTPDVIKDLEDEGVSDSAIGDSTLAKQLENSGMAVTRENMDKLSSAVNFAKEVVSNINEPTISRMVEADLPETIANIYKMEHMESYSEVSVNAEIEETWDKVSD